MKMYKKDYLEMVGKNADFYAVSIVTVNGEELFAYANECEAGVYLLSDPLKISRVADDDGRPNIMFRRFNIFTEDKFTIMKDHVISVMNHLSPAFVRAYDHAREKIHEQDKEIQKILEDVSERSQGNFDSDFYKDVNPGNRSLN